MNYFKVVRKDLTSVGLLGASLIQYKIGEWTYPLETLSNDRLKGGGLWVLKTKSNARRFKKYIETKHGFNIRIFTCEIGIVLFQTSYRVKTDRVMLKEELY
ncbi:MAG: hypothetical protein Q7R86_01975 [bacterium]|nr:hypothetical protein [bacterium]